MAGIYLHIPFCKQACYYCDFHFSTNLEQKQRMTAAIARELTLQKGYLNGAPLESVYFGGGTPSLLSSAELELILQTIRTEFELLPNAEITLEANPDDLSAEKLQQLRQAGINRLSIGIQTFHAETLKALNRAHNREQALRCIEQARQAGFDNFSADLMFALPQAPPEVLAEDVALLVSLGIPHVSCYGLTIEEETVFGRWQRKGRFAEVPEEQAARQFVQIAEALTAAGYLHYEVSNYALPGHQAVHNGNYWKRKPYLGVGPAAHSYNLQTRQANIAHNPRYMRAIENGEIPANTEHLTTQDHINEYLFTSLRTNWGCNLDLLKQEWAYDLEQASGHLLSQYVQEGLMQRSGPVFTFTLKGRLLADHLTASLFAEQAE